MYRLKDFGSYTVGGRIVTVTEGEPRVIQFTRSASYEFDPRGHFAIEHAYVQYFLPEARNDAAPVVLVHGGGLSGSCWETTPDGRPGWLHLLLQRGFEVHVIDNVERGRAGFSPGHLPGEPLLRSMEEAWHLFRIGPKDGFATRAAFAGQLFPVSALEQLARRFVPRWLSTSHLQTSALVATLKKTGPAMVICHSQGGEITFDAHALAPSLFQSIIALEPSGFPGDPAALRETPTRIIAGDHLDTDPNWQMRRAAWQNLARSETCSYIGTRELGPGNSHLLMMDRNSDAILNAALESL
ncbi:MAG: alpha/beta fold hydrolase [Pseudomonadota bacterium]